MRRSWFYFRLKKRSTDWEHGANVSDGGGEDDCKDILLTGSRSGAAQAQRGDVDKIDKVAMTGTGDDEDSQRVHKISICGLGAVELFHFLMLVLDFGS